MLCRGVHSDPGSTEGSAAGRACVVARVQQHRGNASAAALSVGNAGRIAIGIVCG